jgi:hypothetical protein
LEISKESFIFGATKNKKEMEDIVSVKAAYNEILDIVEKHKDICVFDIDKMRIDAKNHLFGTELKFVYGLNLNPKEVRSLQWLNFGEYRHIGWWGQKYNRTISWLNEGKQPEDELLLEISFPTGPYIFAFGSGFNSEYPSEFFQRFWNELKFHSPDYVDDHNHCLYWKIENAKGIFNDFDDILQRYYKLNEEDGRQRKIKAMKDALSELENIG